MTTNTTLKNLKSKTFFEYGKLKNGNYIARKGFFYSSQAPTPEEMEAKIKEIEPDVNIVNKGKQWKPFNGGSSTAKSSHVWVEFN
jgi:hypothetical protein